MCRSGTSIEAVTLTGSSQLLTLQPRQNIRLNSVTMGDKKNKLSVPSPFNNFLVNLPVKINYHNNVLDCDRSKNAYFPLIHWPIYHWTI